MKTDNKVYVIIPVYNAEEHLTETVRSLQAQTLREWMLLLIEDCSKDGSLDLCRRFAEEDSRIKVLSNESNCGPAVTRNKGIDYAVACGARYLSFVDSDDTVTSDYLEKLVSVAEKSRADIVWCNYWEYDYDSRRKKECRHHLACGEWLDNKELLRLFFKGSIGLGSLCNKLYRVEFVTRTGIRLNPERVRAEDWEFNLMLFQQSPRVVAVDDVLYNYIHYPRPSVMSSYRANDFEMFWRSRWLLCEMAAAADISYDIRREDDTMLYNTINHLLILSKASGVPDKKAEFRKIVRDPRLQRLLREGVRYGALPLGFRPVAFMLRHECNRLLVKWLRI